MKSPYQIAKECGVSSQAVYQKIDRMKEQLTTHIQRDGKKILIDEQGETLLKSTFLNLVEQEIEQAKQIVEQAVEYPVEQVVEQGLLKQLNTENEYLREQNNTLMQELSRERQEASKEREQNQTNLEREREHSRQQAERLSELSEKLFELTRNSQVLLKQEQDKSTLLLPEQTKRQFWQFWKK